MSISNSSVSRLAIGHGRRAKHIKIDADHGLQLFIALEDVNGGAREHTYTSAKELEWLAERAERQLEALGVAKKRRAGASVIAVSGGRVPNSYKYRRNLTRVRMERKTAGWYLTSAERLLGHRGGYALSLTPAQDAEAIATVRMGYDCVYPISTRQPVFDGEHELCAA
jgi:hypothetical protein